jgi:hypothetical protein
MSSPWHEHPKLQRRFHRENPDDIQIIVHDGTRAQLQRPELVWVRITACENGIFSGLVRNSSNHFRNVSPDSLVLFIVPEGGEYPLLVTPQYLQERSTWRLLAPCKDCGLTELFDPPSRLVASLFPTLSAAELSQGFTFTTRCGWCGGGQVVRLKRRPA